MRRREFLQVLALSGLGFGDLARAESVLADRLYDLPKPPANTLSLFHLTDCHAQLSPIWYREVSEEGAGSAFEDYLYSRNHFEALAQRFGRVGGFSALKSLIDRLRDQRPQALLLDGGDTWQGSALALKTDGQDMVQAQKILGVDVMTGHWEFTLGRERVQHHLSQLAGTTEFLAQNVAEEPFGDPVFKPWTLKEQHGIPYAVIGQAFPWTPIAHPKRFTEGWTFGLKEKSLQAHVDDARAKGARAVILLSHNGLPVDLKLASRVRGIDLILGGHTHDPLPQPVAIQNPGGVTWVTNAGSHGKFLGVADLTISPQGLDLHYRLLPVMAELLPKNAEMDAWIKSVRAPHRAYLEAPVGLARELLFRRDLYEGSYDRLILKALLALSKADIALSPGFRWGTVKLPGETLTREDLLGITAVTYPEVQVRMMTGESLKDRLEDIADNVFNPDPYYQEGGDMVRVGGLRFTCDPDAPMGQRIRDLRLKDEPLSPYRQYSVASWASMNEGEALGSMAEWLERYLKNA